MKSSRFVFVLVAVAVVAILTADAQAVYHVKMGRFLQRDPIGVQDRIGVVQFRSTGTPFMPRDFEPRRQYHDGMNTVEYVASRPLILRDPFGLTYHGSLMGDGAGNWIIPPISSKPVCCWYKEGKAKRCDSLTLENPQKQTPMGRCKCHFASQPNVTVIRAHAGKCCWCYASLQMVGTHMWINVRCTEPGRNYNYSVEHYPERTKGFAGGDPPENLKINYYGPDGNDDSFLWWYEFGSVELKRCRISCRQASRMLEAFKEMKLRFNIVTQNCWDFARPAFDVLCGDGC